MIFKTFNSDIDKISSKWGIFGKSFNDIGTNIISKWENVSKTLQATNDYTLQNIAKAWKTNNSNPIAFLEKNEIASILNNYNKALDSGAESTAKFLDSGTGNEFMDGFLKDLDGTPATMDKYNAAMKKATTQQKAFSISTIATKAAVLALNVAVSMGLSVALSALLKVIGEVIQSEENLKDSAREIGSELSNNTSYIEDYKNKIEELKDVLNDSSSSFDDVSRARLDLMKIQDELIDKFGTEKGVIEDITEAIYGQTNALDNLSKDAYFKSKNEFNKKTIGEKFKDWLSFGNTDDNRIQSNMDKMVNQMESSVYKLETTGNEVLDNLIAKSYGLNIYKNMYGDGQHFLITGGLDEIQQKLYGIQELSQDFDVSTGFENNFTEISNDVDSLLQSYQDLYDQYILYEKVLADNPNNEYDEQFNLINKAKDSYNNALKSGDANVIQKASDEYAKILSSAIDLAMSNYDYSVADYFKNMYPDMQQLFSEWKFNFDFEPNTDGIKDKITNSLENLDGFSSEDILNFNPNIATEEQVSAYGELNNVAEQYGLTLQQLINLLLQMGLIHSESYQQLVNQFGQDNVNKIAPEDLTFAYQIENVGKMTFEEFQAEIQRLKNKAEEINPIPLSTITDSIKQISKQVEPQISALSDLLTSLYDGETWGFDANLIDHGMLEELRTTFAELEEDIGVEFPTEELENFYSVLADGVATEEEAKNAINDLATKWFYATNTLDNLNEKTAGAIEQQLEQMNVTNAQEVVQENLAGLMESQALQSEFLAAVTSDLNGETQNATQAFLEEAVSSDVAKNALIELAYAEIMVNSNDLDMTQKCAELQKLASAAFGAAAALKFETLMAESARYNGGYTEANAQAAWDQVLNEFSSFELPEIEVGFDTSKAAKAAEDAAKKYKEALEKELSNMGDVLNYITDIIDDQIDAWNDQKDAAVDALEAERDAAIEALEAQKESLELQKEAIEDKIEAKEKEIQAIQDARKERQAEIDLQKKQYELERLQNQKTMLIYSDDKGYHYQTDVTGIRDAREAVDEAKEEIKIIAIEKEISVLEEQVTKIDDAIEGIDKQIDATNDHYDKLINQTEAYYDSIIKGLENYKSRWEEIGEIEEQAKMQVALKNLGIETTDILNMSEDAFNAFKTQYLSILTELYSGEEQMLDAINSVAQGIDYTTLETGLLKTKENIDKLNSADFNSVKTGLNDIATEMGSVGTSASTASSNTSAVSDDLKEINTSTEGLDTKLSGISDALNGIPARDKIDGLKDAFGLLATEIQNVANALGVGEGSVSGLVTALQEISMLSLNGEEGGIVTDFQNLKTAIDGVTSAINGGGGSMATEGGGLATGANGGAAQPTGEGGGSGLTGAIKEIGTATNETFGTGGETGEGGESEGGEGEGAGVLGKFSAFKTAVDNVTKAIGTGEEEEEELSLISALQMHYTKAEETLPQVKARFEELLQSIAACVDKLAELAGAMSSLGGGISLGGAGVVVAEPNATGTDPGKSFSTRVGKAFAKGTGAFKGLPKDTLALRSEYNQPELTIYPDGETVELTNSPTLSMLPKGTQILNEKQTNEVLNNKGINGKAYVDGSLPNGLVPLSSVDLDKYNMLTALGSVPGNIEMGVKHLDMLDKNVHTMVENINKINNINNNPTIEINNPQFTCTGVTGEQVLHEIQMQFSGLFLNAYQNAMKR